MKARTAVVPAVAVALALLLFASWSATAQEAPKPKAYTLSGVTFTVPSDVEVLHQSLPTGQDGIQALRGNETLVVVVYDPGKKPTERKALAVHTEALERRILDGAGAGAAVERKTSRTKVLGKKRRTIRLTWRDEGVTQHGHVVAARHRGRTLAVMWQRPEGQAGFAEALVETLDVP